MDRLTMGLHAPKDSAEHVELGDRLVNPGFYVRSTFPAPNAGCGYLYGLRGDIAADLMAETQ